MFEIESVQIKESHALLVLSTGERLPIPGESVKIYAAAAGKVIDHEEYERLKDESGRFSCYRKALLYLSMRARSVFELERYLLGKGYHKKHVQEASARLVERGYLDDLAYAMRYIEKRRGGRAVGKNRILAELFRKGVPGDVVRRALAEYPEGVVDQEELFRLAADKYERLKGKKDAKRKLIFFLRQRGFEGDEIRKAVERLPNEDVIIE